MPQLIYYRLRAWNTVSTPPRASNLPLRRYQSHFYNTLLQDNIDLQCSTPREREGSSKTDNTQYCNSKKHQNREDAQLLATPPMHQIQPNGSIKDYLRYTDVNMEHKLKTSKEKHPDGVCVLSFTSFSVSERKFSLVKCGCPCCIYTWGV